MKFNVSAHLEYAIEFPSTLIFNIHAQKNSGQTIVEEKFEVTPPLEVEEFSLDHGGNRFVRLETGQTSSLTIDYQAIVDCATEVVPAIGVDPTSIAEMDRNAILYLFPSRYCESDQMGTLAWDLFGKIPDPYQKVVAVADWVHANVAYAIGSSNSETSAYDIVIQRRGVCRDFAHLGIALCRALNIPARYFSGYAYQLNPPDFHACFECYIGGQWLIFDATRLVPLNGLVRIGTGRDAADAAVASTFGAVTGTNIKVDCQLAAGERFVPVGRKQLRKQGMSLESGNVTPAD
jgi:transglutaminase-like putative cysteine protease